MDSFVVVSFLMIYLKAHDKCARSRELRVKKVKTFCNCWTLKIKNKTWHSIGTIKPFRHEWVNGQSNKK